MTVRQLPVIRIYLLGLAALAVTGCGSAMMNVEDVVIAPGRPAHFVVSMDREFMKPSVVGADVSILVNGRPIGRATTDSKGVASVNAHLDGSPSTFLAQARIDGADVHGHGRIFHWDPHRTIVAIDVDDTISHTDYSDLFIARFDTTSPAFDHSSQVVRRMSQRYQILYVTARPRWLMEKTRAWLDRAGFPPGPILTAPGFEGCFRQGYYKDKSLEAFQREFPNLLAGVGDKWQDDYAYGNRRMLGVILGRSTSKYRHHILVQRDWREIGEFFDRYANTLADARQLSTLIETSNMDLRRVFTGDNATLLASVQPHEQSAVAASPPPNPNPAGSQIHSMQFKPIDEQRVSAVIRRTEAAKTGLVGQ